MRTVAKGGTHRMRSVAVMTAVLVLAGATFVSGPAGASSSKSKAKSTAAKVTDGTMTWAVSQYVSVPTPATLSVSEALTATAPATFAAGTGWTFTDGTGTYDTKTGAMTVSFAGALEFGNTSRGNYGFKFANPVLTLDASGVGTLTAEVSLRPVGGAPFGAPTKVVLVDVTGAAPTTTKKTVSVAVTPTVFADPLLVATADLSSHFKASGSPNDSLKPPAPISVEFDYKVKKPKS